MSLLTKKDLKIITISLQIIQTPNDNFADFAVIAMSKQGQAIKLAGSDVPLRGRMTIGVRIMKLRKGDYVATTVIMHI